MTFSVLNDLHNDVMPDIDPPSAVSVVHLFIIYSFTLFFYYPHYLFIYFPSLVDFVYTDLFNLSTSYSRFPRPRFLYYTLPLLSSAQGMTISQEVIGTRPSHYPPLTTLLSRVILETRNRAKRNEARKNLRCKSPQNE